MKKYLLFTLGLLFFAALAAPACSNKSGCPAQESLKPPVNRKGEIKTKKRGKQDGLFPKKMSRRMK